MTAAVLSSERIGRITGSRVAAVLGISPYASPDDCLREMVRQAHGAPDEFTGNLATEWGREHEPDAIVAYEQHTGEPVFYAGDAQRFVPHPKVGWLGCTPDGVSGDGAVIETKCPLWGAYSVWQDTPWYEAQLRLAMECEDADRGEFVVWRPQGTVISRIERDPWWLEQHMPTLEAFHARYLEVVADPALYGPLCEPLKDVRTDGEWSDAAARYRECVALQKAAEAQAAEAREALLALTDKSAVGCGVSVNCTTRKGPVAYKTALADLAPDADLDAYRAAETTVWTVRLS